MNRPSTAGQGKDELLSIEEAAKILHVPGHRLAQWRCKGIGPAYVKIGRDVLYRRSVLEKFILDQEVIPSNAA